MRLAHKLGALNYALNRWVGGCFAMWCAFGNAEHLTLSLIGLERRRTCDPSFRCLPSTNFNPNNCLSSNMAVAVLNTAGR